MHRIYVKYTTSDARAKSKLKHFSALGLQTNIGAVYLVDCYTIDSKLDKKQIEKTKALLANPLMQTAEPYLLPLTSRSFSYAIEVGYLPGVTDNIGNTAKETLQDGAKIKFKPGQNVYSSQVLFISGDLSRGNIKKIADSLYNPLIQRATIKSYAQFKKDAGMGVTAPKVKLKGNSKVTKVDLNISDKELEKLGKLGIADAPSRPSAAESRDPEIRKHWTPDSLSDALKASGVVHRRGPLALSLEELKAIRSYFNSQNRKPTDVELEALAQTWSEHCKHTIFSDPFDELKDGIYRTYIKRATEVIRKQKGRKDFCVSVFTDNAGGISFDKDYIISHKVETHNTPSALDPFGGAITGIVGVNRDSLGFGLGAKPVANVYGFCLGAPDDKSKLYRDKNLQSPMLSSRRIMDGVIAGINAGGNQSGIPTPLGFLYFDPRFRAKPLVFAGTLGLTPKKIGGKNGWEKQAKPNDLIVMVGGRVGADGIHGATFASEGLDQHSPATAVQIGDPITQKKLSDALAKEARGQNLYNSITDCGAGGLSSAIGEMAGQSNGCEVNLDKVPLKYPGLAPWQIWISESQERMVVAVAQGKWEKLQKLMNSRGVEATIIGKFTNSGKCVVKYGKQNVLDVTLEFLHNGRPKKYLSSKAVKSKIADVKLASKNNYSDDALKLLSRLNLTSNEFLSRQYDHEVQGSSVQKPLQGRGRVNSEASVFRPVLESQKGVVVSYGLHPELSEINPYNMAAASIDTAIRAAVAAGANVDYLALLDNFCWCSPEDPKRLWQLKQAAKACYDFATAFGTPFISGKDSMYNDFKGFSNDGKSLKISIPPTLLISAVGVVPNISKTISLDLKMPGDLLYILGGTNDELGGSEYLGMIGKTGGLAPKVDAEKNLKLYRSFYQAAQKNLVVSAISLNRSGLAGALTKTAMAGGLGAEVSLINLPGKWKENYQALFSESLGRILVSVDPKKFGEFEKLMQGNIFAKIGKVTKGSTLVVADKNNKKIVKVNINQALKNYRATFKDF